MTNWYVRSHRWLGDVVEREDGATAVEYALMVALIALVIVAAVALLGEQTSSAFEDPVLVAGLS